MKTKLLLQAWEISITNIVEEFTKTYYDEECWLYRSYWINDDIGGVFIINEEFWDFECIKDAVKFDCPKEELFNYYYMSVDAAMEGKKLEYNFVNYIKYFNRTIN